MLATLLVFINSTFASRDDRYLLLDSRITESTENVQLTVSTFQKDENNPLFKEDKPWEPRSDNPYCSVIYDEEEKNYKCWYSIFIKSGREGGSPGEGLTSEKRAWVDWTEGEREFVVCYATSSDGIHWEKPELVIEFNGSSTDKKVEWRDGFALKKHGAVQIQFEFQDATIYLFSFID